MRDPKGTRLTLGVPILVGLVMALGLGLGCSDPGEGGAGLSDLTPAGQASFGEGPEDARDAHSGDAALPPSEEDPEPPAEEDPPPVVGDPICPPGASRCANLFTPEVCAADGSGWQQAGMCPEGQSCHDATGQCGPMACNPGAKQCAGGASIQSCVTDGSAWAQPEACPEGHQCEGSFCVSPDCFPGVMFLVDRSTSMGKHWQNVRQSTLDVIANNPGIKFGLSAFPSDDGFFAGCSTGSNWPHVAIQEDAGPVLDDWWATHDVNGATPLRSAVRWMSENVDQVWGPTSDAGFLIVLSDGEDKCACSIYENDPDKRSECVAEELVEYTQDLLDQGIRTYVIGYNYFGNPIELNAIAENGGTDQSEFIFAGSEETLTNVFNQLLGDIKNCL